MKPTTQIYSNYTAEDFLVWKTLFNRQMNVLNEHASVDFLRALRIIDFKPEKIPDFYCVNLILRSLTGWSLHIVPAISSQNDFFEFLSQKKFTATCWLRSMKQLDYIEEPDLFHDVFAHTPLLTNPVYCRFFKGMGDIAQKYREQANFTILLGKIYWFTIEFGLINEDQGVKIYGAGILSSLGETENALAPSSLKIPFDVDTILKTEYRTDQIQEVYFVIDSFEQLASALPSIEQKIVAHCQAAVLGS